MAAPASSCARSSRAPPSAGSGSPDKSRAVCIASAFPPARATAAPVDSRSRRRHSTIRAKRSWPMDFQEILLERDGGAAIVTLNRPERRNALSLRMLQELTACFRGLGEDAQVRAVILRANGPVFCAGHDLSEMVGKDPAFYRQLFEACTAVMETMQGIPQPVIAQVHATATAAGCQLVASCDLAVAAP